MNFDLLDYKNCIANLPNSILKKFGVDYYSIYCIWSIKLRGLIMAEQFLTLMADLDEESQRWILYWQHIIHSVVSKTIIKMKGRNTMQRILHFPQLNSVWSNPVVVVWHDGLIADGKNCVVRYPKGKSIE